MDGNRSRGRGFTFVELMIVLAIVAVLLGVAVPAFQRLQVSTSIRGEVHQLMSDIVSTRSEAIKRNVQVVMCPSRSFGLASRACEGVFAEGWIIFADRDRDRELDAGEEVIRTGNGMPETFTLTNRAATRNASEKIVYRPDGTSRRNRALMICSTVRPDVPSWSVVMNVIGRPRMARGWGECPGVEEA